MKGGVGLKIDQSREVGQGECLVFRLFCLFSHLIVHCHFPVITITTYNDHNLFTIIVTIIMVDS